jgi:putative acetyltransferase
MHGLRCEYDVPVEAFMVAELVPCALAGRRGLVRYRPEFADT